MNDSFLWSEVKSLKLLPFSRMTAYSLSQPQSEVRSMTAYGPETPPNNSDLRTASSLLQAHIQVQPMTASGPQLPLMAKNELIAIAKLQAEIAPQLPTFIFERRPQTTALRTTNLRAYSAG